MDRIPHWAMVTLGIGAGALIVWVFIAPKESNLEKLQAQQDREAQIQLRRICDLQTAWFEEKGAYASKLEDLDYYQGPNEGAKFRYSIANADSSDFRVIAYGVEDTDRDGEFGQWEIAADCKPVKTKKD